MAEHSAHLVCGFVGLWVAALMGVLLAVLITILIVVTVVVKKARSLMNPPRAV